MAALAKFIRKASSFTLLSQPTAQPQFCHFRLTQVSNSHSITTYCRTAPILHACVRFQPLNKDPSQHQNRFCLTQSQLKALRHFSAQKPNTENSKKGKHNTPTDAEPTQAELEEDESKMTVFQKFKHVYKQYGKILIGVHIVTSTVWYGGFYLMAYSGIDLLPFLMKFGISEALQAKYLAAGDFLVAYILYEIAKPVRYLATLAATRQTVVYLKKVGYLPPIAPEDKLRSLARDGRDNLREKYQEQREEIKEKYADKKAEYQQRWEESRDKGRSALKQPSWKAQKTQHTRPSPHSSIHMRDSRPPPTPSPKQTVTRTTGSDVNSKSQTGKQSNNGA